MQDDHNATLHGVSSVATQAEGASGSVSTARTPSPLHATKGGTPPLTYTRGQQRGENATGSKNLLGNQHPRALGLRESNVPGAATQQPQSMTQFYDRYLIVEGIGEPALCRLSPFAISKHLNGAESIQRLRSGDYLITSNSETQTEHFLKMKKLGDCQIRVRPHVGLNQVKGVIESAALKNDVTKEEIIEDLQDYGVVDCYFHQRKHQNGDSENNGRVTLTFKGQERPRQVTIAGWLHCKVRTYVPNPLRCFQCHMYGHITSRCKRERRCANCGKDCQGPCENPAQCVNCGGEHSAFDRNCPKWLEEKEIQKIKAEQNISYKEAKDRVAPKRTTGSVSYAAAAQSTPLGGSQPSSEVAAVMQLLVKQMEQLQKQVNVVFERMGLLQQDPKTTENVSQVNKESPNHEAPKPQRKRSLTRTERTSSSEELPIKRRPVNIRDQSMVETGDLEETLLNTDYGMLEDEEENPTPIKGLHPKTGPQLPVAVKSVSQLPVAVKPKSPPNISGLPTKTEPATGSVRGKKKKNNQGTPQIGGANLKNLPLSKK